jgi:RNA polymerase sigma-70 factor (ECF subfamily)
VTASGAEPAIVRDAVRAVRGGDADAFGHIVRLYQRRVFGLALMLVRDPAAAEEVAQDAFVRAFTHLEAYNAALPFYPWLATITVRLAQNRLAHQRSLTAREAPPAAQEIEDPAPGDALAKLISDEDGRRLWDAVAGLPAGERSAVVMHYRQDLGVREIARAMGVTAGTVKTFLFRARQKLRRLAETLSKESA